MKKILVLLIALTLALTVCACQKNDSDSSTKDEAVVTTAVTSVIATPYAELRMPEDYPNNVTYAVESDDPYTLTFFSSDGTKLYSLIFNGEGSVLIGSMRSGDDTTTVSVTVYPLNNNSETYEKNAEYQEEMDVILSNLRADYTFDNGTGEEIPETFEIKTDVVTLRYPKKWQDKVDVKNDKDTVTFSSDNTDLFIVSFADNGGYLLGTYQGHPIYLTLCPLDSVKNDADKYNEMSKMQDDSNILLENLESDPDFVSAHSSD